uniref:Uncharacterized protein n=1 Tax=Strigamia maritima TaxID=126957 RepID=T1JKP2_STRMM
MPARKKSNKMKRKKPGNKQQNQPQLQFLEGNEDHAGVPTTSHSRHSEVELDDNDVIENSQPNMTTRIFHRSVLSDMDKQLRDAGLFEDGMTDSQKEDILSVLEESRKMAEENEPVEDCSEGSDDLFSRKGPYSKAINCFSKENIEEAKALDEDFVIPVPARPKEKRQIKPRNIFTTFLVENVKETTNSVRQSENTIGENTLVSLEDGENTLVSLEDGEKSLVEDNEETVAKTDSIPGNKTVAPKNRSVLLRPTSSSSRKQINRDRESPLMNHIPLFAPSDTAPRMYTQVIRGYFDTYIESVSQVEQVMPRIVSWANPVVVGRHNRFTIDALRPGQRARNVELWYQMAMKGCTSDLDISEINPKKPRLESDSETSMTIDDDECVKDEELKSYLKDEPDFEFQPEKSQKSYGRRKSMSEEKVYVLVPPDEVSDNDTPDAIDVDTSKDTSKDQHTQMDEEDNPNANQSFVKKIIGKSWKENNSSLFSVIMPWKNPFAKQGDKKVQVQRDNKTSDCPMCHKSFNKDKIEDHAAQCGLKDSEEELVSSWTKYSETEQRKEWCYMCQRVIAGIPVQCGRHSKINNSNDTNKH